MKIGVQLYTLRDFCKDTQSLSETLKKVADMGYTTVQLSGICAYDPEWMAGQLKENGLTCPLTHTSPDRIADDTMKVIEEHRIFGCSNIGIGCSNIYEDREKFDSFVKRFKEPAKVLKENGMYLMYHNHNLEFNQYDDSDKIVLEMLCEAFSPDELGITLDTFWVQAGGGDPVWWIHHLKGRTPCIHLKDLAYRKSNDLTMLPVGSGNMNFEAILAACEDEKVQYGLVEQDVCNGRDPFDCIKDSYDFLKSFGLN